MRLRFLPPFSESLPCDDAGRMAGPSGGWQGGRSVAGESHSVCARVRNPNSRWDLSLSHFLTLWFCDVLTFWRSVWRSDVLTFWLSDFLAFWFSDFFPSYFFWFSDFSALLNFFPSDFLTYFLTFWVSNFVTFLRSHVLAFLRSCVLTLHGAAAGPAATGAAGASSAREPPWCARRLSSRRDACAAARWLRAPTTAQHRLLRRHAAGELGPGTSAARHRRARRI